MILPYRGDIGACRRPVRADPFAPQAKSMAMDSVTESAEYGAETPEGDPCGPA